MRICVDGASYDQLTQHFAIVLPVSMSIVKHGRVCYWSGGGGLDCETTRTDTDHSYVYIWQMSINGIVFYGRYADSLTDFLLAVDLWLFRLHNKRSHKRPKTYPQLLIYDANCGYEWAHLKRQMCRCGVSKIFAKNPRRPLMIRLARCIEIRECLGVWGYSLANIADTYTRTKKMLGDLRYDLPRHSETELTEEEWGYVENDVLILSELAEIAHRKYEGRALPMTGTGIVRNAVKERLEMTGSLKIEKLKIRQLLPDTPEEYEVMSHWLYSGGWSHSKISAVRETMRQPYEHVVCADLVSDYPAQMLHMRFPAGRMLSDMHPMDMFKCNHWWCLMTFYDLDSKNGHSLISAHKCISLSPDAVIDNGRVMCASEVQVYVTEIDYTNISRIYTFSPDIFCEDCHGFTKSEPIPEHLRHVLCMQYRLKNELKAAGKKDTIEYTESKKFVNGCYGMCATKIYLTECVFDESKGDLQMKDTEKDYEALIADVWLSPWIAIYTAAYARAILTAFVAQFPELVVQYDTDSIYFRDDQTRSRELRETIKHYNQAVTERNRRIFNGDTFFDTLGTWEIDPPCDKFKCLGAKRYLKQTGDKIKITCAGCKPDAFKAYCKRTGADPFDMFTNGMLLLCDDSGKTTLVYHDKPHDCVITDYLGVSRVVHIETCGLITKIPFKMSMSKTWLETVETFDDWNDHL